MLYRQPRHKSLADALSLEKLTSQSGDLEKLIQKANQLQEFSQIVNNCLPDLFKGKLLINGLQQQTLVLTSPSATLATRFRVNQQEFLTRLRQQMPYQAIQDVKIKIRPRKFRTEVQQTKRRLSKENAQILEEEAGQTDDKNLREALTKLAKRAK